MTTQMGAATCEGTASLRRHAVMTEYLNRLEVPGGARCSSSRPRSPIPNTWGADWTSTQFKRQGDASG